MIFKTCIDNLLSRFPSASDTQSRRDQIKNYFNFALLEVYRAAPWEFRKRIGQVPLIPNYTTGTCTITKFDTTNETAARTVNFSGSTLTQSMVGRYFSVNGSTTWYKIVSISGSTALLDVPVVDNSGSGLSFSIWKRFYYVKSDADVITDFGSWEYGTPLAFKSSTNFTDSNSNISSTGNPSTFVPYGVDPYDDKFYSDGTISANVNSNTVTGVGTAFIANADIGDVLTVSGIEYQIKRVESDTSIILKNYVTPAIPAGSSYTIRKNNPAGFEFYYNSDQYRIMHYEYLSRGYKLINEDYDYFYMPEEYLIAVWDRAESMYRRDTGDANWQSVLALYQGELDGLKLKRLSTEPRFTQFAPKIDVSMPGRG